MKSFSERNPVLLGAVGTLVLILVATGVFFYQDLPVLGGGTVYRAEFSEAAGLRPDDEVRVAGVKVGEVTGVELVQDDTADRVLVSFRVAGRVDRRRHHRGDQAEDVAGPKVPRAVPDRADHAGPGPADPAGPHGHPLRRHGRVRGAREHRGGDRLRAAGAELPDHLRHVRRLAGARAHRARRADRAVEDDLLAGRPAGRAARQHPEDHPHAVGHQRRVRQAPRRRQPAARPSWPTAARPSTTCSPAPTTWPRSCPGWSPTTSGCSPPHCPNWTP